MWDVGGVNVLDMPKEPDWAESEVLEWLQRSYDLHLIEYEPIPNSYPDFKISNVAIEVTQLQPLDYAADARVLAIGSSPLRDTITSAISRTGYHASFKKTYDLTIKGDYRRNRTKLELKGVKSWTKHSIQEIGMRGHPSSTTFELPGLTLALEPLGFKLDRPVVTAGMWRMSRYIPSMLFDSCRYAIYRKSKLASINLDSIGCDQTYLILLNTLSFTVQPHHIPRITLLAQSTQYDEIIIYNHSAHHDPISLKCTDQKLLNLCARL